VKEPNVFISTISAYPSTIGPSRGSIDDVRAAINGGLSFAYYTSNARPVGFDDATWSAACESIALDAVRDGAVRADLESRGWLAPKPFLVGEIVMLSETGDLAYVKQRRSDGCYDVIRREDMYVLLGVAPDKLRKVSATQLDEVGALHGVRRDPRVQHQESAMNMWKGYERFVFGEYREATAGIARLIADPRTHKMIAEIHATAREPVRIEMGVPRVTGSEPMDRASLRAIVNDVWHGHGASQTWLHAADPAHVFAWCEKTLVGWARDPRHDSPRVMEAVTKARREVDALRRSLHVQATSHYPGPEIDRPEEALMRSLIRVCSNTPDLDPESAYALSLSLAALCDVMIARGGAVTAETLAEHRRWAAEHERDASGLELRFDVQGDDDA